MCSARIECPLPPAPGASAAPGHHRHFDFGAGAGVESIAASASTCGLLSFAQGLGPCQLEEQGWGSKMSAVIVPEKKRKKLDSNGQAQLSKCLNEKKRRQQENHHIEDLAVLLQHEGEMNSLSVKPDKCAILECTVKQIGKIQENSSGDAVQQADVSSSKPTILPNDVFGNLLLEVFIKQALDGFLFVVNPDGKVEYVTDNVTHFIKYKKEDILGRSIYNIIHLGDHNKFATIVLGISQLQNTQQDSAPRNRTFICRFKSDDPNQNDPSTNNEENHFSDRYEYLQISSTQVPLPGDNSSGGIGGGGGEGGSSSSSLLDGYSDSGRCIMCIARRIEKSIGPVEQFTIKLDRNGTIINLDIQGVSATYSQYLNRDLLHKNIEELCHAADVPKVKKFLEDTLSKGQCQSVPYRLSVSSAHDKYIHVQTLFKHYDSGPAGDEFIMATHSIMPDSNDMDMSHSPRSIGSGSSSSVSALMSNGGGGATGGRAVSSSDTVSNSFSSSVMERMTSLDAFGGDDSLGIDTTPSSTGISQWGAFAAATAPAQHQPPTPTHSMYGGGGPPSYDATPSPHQEAPATPHDGGGGSDKEEASDSRRLRKLLTNRRTSSVDSNDGCHKILKNLLDKDDEQHANTNTNEQQPKASSGGGGGNHMLLKLLNDKNDVNDLEAKVNLRTQEELLQLLKDEENSTKCEMQTDDESALHHHNHHHQQQQQRQKRPSEEGDDSSSCSSGGAAAAKRPSLSVLDTLPSPSPSPATPSSSHLHHHHHHQQQQHHPHPALQHPVTSSNGGGGGGNSNTKNSNLWEKNKMLASLLAKQPPTPTTIPHIPASIISATPQDKLPRIVKQQAATANWTGGGLQQQQNVMRPMQQQQLVDSTGRGRTPQQQQQLQQQQQRQQYVQQQLLEQQQSQQRFDFRTSGQDFSDSSDPYLSEILDEVIEIVDVADPSVLMNVLGLGTSGSDPGGGGSGGSQTYQQTSISDQTSIIQAIQNQLMQETSVNQQRGNPSNAQQQQQQQFHPPPPLYQAPRQPQRFPPNMQPNQMAAGGIRPGGGAPHYAAAMAANQQQQQQQQILLHKKQMLQQHQQKQRLLQQQQQQQMLIPSNAAAPGPDPGLHNIDLINNTGPPNVSLQRSSSVPDSQLSPSGYGASQISPGQRGAPQQQQPYSPLGPQQQQQQPFSPVNGPSPLTSYQPQPSPQQRLSPSGQQLPSFQQQSPRGQQQQQQQQQYGGGGMSPTWSQQQQNSRLSLQQQQNPMLNAQLTGGAYNTRVQYATSPSPGQRGGGGGGGGGVGPTQLPPVRSLTSPGARQSPFPPEVSPTTAASYQQTQQQQQQQFRVQRAISAPGPPQATTQLPGGVRHYGPAMKEHSPLASPYHNHNHQTHHHQHPHPHPHSHPSHQHMMYPSDSPSPSQPPQPQSQFCFDQVALQYYGTSCDRGRLAPNTGGNNGMTEYVRQELRAMVGARTGGSGVVVGGGVQGVQRPPSQQQQQLHLAPGQPVTAADLEALGLSFEPGGTDLGTGSPQPPCGHPSRNNMDEVSRSTDQKSSLLQKLLSE